MGNPVDFNIKYTITNKEHLDLGSPRLIKMFKYFSVSFVCIFSLFPEAVALIRLSIPFERKLQLCFIMRVCAAVLCHY